jgi:PIN domain nuclease of toxin-antitoxin system
LKLLLDKHLLLWAAGMTERLPAAARTLIADPRNEPLFSAASLWEIAVKRGLGRKDFQVDPGCCGEDCSITTMVNWQLPASMRSL